MKLTKAQFRALNQMADTSRIYFTSSEGREAACSLDAMGLAAVYTDSGNSLGIVVAGITPAGRSLLNKEAQKNE